MPDAVAAGSEAEIPVFTFLTGVAPADIGFRFGCYRDCSGYFHTVFIQHGQEHDAIFDDHVSEESGVLAVSTERMNARVTDERICWP